jgi:uncharacterized protein (TIGR00266 family)
MLDVDLEDHESFYAEAGAMVSMEPNVETSTERPMGFVSSMMRKVFGGESIYLARFDGPGRVQVAPTLVGEVRHMHLQGNNLLMQPGAYLASTPEVEVHPTYAGFKSMIGGEGLFFLDASGSGDLFFNAYGAIYEVEVDGRFICDTGHVVAFDPHLGYSLTSPGGFLATFFSGEGLIFEFEGQGRLYMQSRHLQSFVDWLTPMLPN